MREKVQLMTVMNMALTLVTSRLVVAGLRQVVLLQAVGWLSLDPDCEWVQICLKCPWSGACMEWAENTQMCSYARFTRTNEVKQNSQANLGPLLQLCMCGVTQSCLTLCAPMDCSLLGSSVHGIFRLEYWSGLPLLTPWDLPGPGIEPKYRSFPALQADSLPTEPSGKPLLQLHLLRFHWPEQVTWPRPTSVSGRSLFPHNWKGESKYVLNKWP